MGRILHQLQYGSVYHEGVGIEQTIKSKVPEIVGVEAIN